jgi:hypothetical protein
LVDLQDVGASAEAVGFSVVVGHGPSSVAAQNEP